jgi:hypothetical protein
MVRVPFRCRDVAASLREPWFGVELLGGGADFSGVRLMRLPYACPASGAFGQ